MKFIQLLKRAVLLLITTSSCIALPDIPSFSDCEDIIYNSGFQDDSDPSNGVGGEAGSYERFVSVGGIQRRYYIYVPSGYASSKALPVMLAFHGTAGSANAAITQAQAVRGIWQTTAEQNNIIIIAPVGTSSNGSWVVGVDFPPVLNAILADMFSRYNIEKRRLYGYGFSSGGHVMHTLMLFYNQNKYAAYVVSAGVLQGDAVIEDPNVPANNSVVPVYISHGNADNVVALSFAQSDYTKFQQAGWVADKTVWLDIFNGGHVPDSQVTSKSWDKLCIFSNL